MSSFCKSYTLQFTGGFPVTRFMLFEQAVAHQKRHTPFAHLDRHWGRREENPMSTGAVAEGTYRYVRVPAKNGPTTEELFDAAGDAGELDSVLDANPEVAARLRARVDGYIENSQTPWEEPPVELEVDEMQLNQLRALGYSLP